MSGQEDASTFSMASFDWREWTKAFDVALEPVCSTCDAFRCHEDFKCTDEVMKDVHEGMAQLETMFAVLVAASDDVCTLPIKEEDGSDSTTNLNSDRIQYTLCVASNDYIMCRLRQTIREMTLAHECLLEEEGESGSGGGGGEEDSEEDEEEDEEEEDVELCRLECATKAAEERLARLVSERLIEGDIVKLERMTFTAIKTEDGTKDVAIDDPKPETKKVKTSGKMQSKNVAYTLNSVCVPQGDDVVACMCAEMERLREEVEQYKKQIQALITTNSILARQLE
jgi:hypothetical protein